MEVDYQHTKKKRDVFRGVLSGLTRVSIGQTRLYGMESNGMVRWSIMGKKAFYQNLLKQPLRKDCLSGQMKREDLVEGVTRYVQPRQTGVRTAG